MLLENLETIEIRYQEINKQIEANISDYQQVAELSKEKADLDDVVRKAREYRQTLKAIEEAEQLVDSDDEELKGLASADLLTLRPKADQLEQALKNLLSPKDPRDQKNVIMEIRAGTGGDEAGLFAADLFRMYSRYAENNRWTIEILSQNDTGIGSIKEVVFSLVGSSVFADLKFESGVHRVQRVPVTESSGRIHTSTTTVAVLPEAEDGEVYI